MLKGPQAEESLKQVRRWEKTIVVGAVYEGGPAAQGAENMQKAGYMGAWHAIEWFGFHLQRQEKLFMSFSYRAQANFSVENRLGGDKMG